MITVGRKVILITISWATALAGMSQSSKKQPMEWLTPEEMELQYNQLKKPILVDVYTNWCYYCKVMDNTTWKNDSVTAYLKDHFYIVKLNAESKEPYQWMGEKFEYAAKYKVNTLAIKLLQGNMTYPSTIIIPEKGEPEIIAGAFTAKELEMILKYYGEKTNETIDPESFMRKFSGNWK